MLWAIDGGFIYKCKIHGNAVKDREAAEGQIHRYRTGEATPFSACNTFLHKLCLCLLSCCQSVTYCQALSPGKQLRERPSWWQVLCACIRKDGTQPVVPKEVLYTAPTLRHQRHRAEIRESMLSVTAMEPMPSQMIKGTGYWRIAHAKNNIYVIYLSLWVKEG